MRPFPGDDTFPGRQRHSENDPAFYSASSTPQMTYFLGGEESMEASLQQSATTQQRNYSKKPFTDQPSMSSSLSLDDHKAARNDNSDARSHITETSSTNAPSASLPMTPVLFGCSEQGSALSGASSRRNSLTGSFLEDQYSRGQSVVGDTEKEIGSTMLESGSAPQLVMPSIKMPSRRPFTDTGKNMGRLKVLIAGDSGVGKTSLIKAIVQTCEHIVHVDPITPPSAASTIKKGKGRRGSRLEASTQRLTEIYASTKPYPAWWSVLDDVSVLKRKSLGDAVLERNLCFVDTPGYGSGSSAMDVIKQVVKYVETQLRRISSDALDESELLSMVGGDGGCQVDAVFYIINNNIKPADVEYLRLLSPLTNIIPILARADSLSSEEVALRKQQLLSEIQQADIRPFNFGNVSPYAVSSATGSDLETMDASLLMSPDYVQPLIPTDLALLVRDVFCQNGTSWLRHSAARKYLQWRHGNQEIATRGLPLQLPPPPPPETTLGPVSTSLSSYSLARIADHTQREERMAQIRLANWAAELQRSLERERAHYENLARSERAVWLTERLSECVQNGTLVPLTSPQKPKVKSTRRRRASKTASHQDPLGLLEVVAKFKRRGRMALELLGSVGVLGGLVFWAHRHYWHGRVYEWCVEEWILFWGLDK